MMVEISPGTMPKPNKTNVGIKYTNVGTVCIRSRIGLSKVYNQGRCAAMIPSGTPINTEIVVAANTRTKVSAFLASSQG